MYVTNNGDVQFLFHNRPRMHTEYEYPGDRFRLRSSCSVHVI